jgi:hypothetical protein
MITQLLNNEHNNYSLNNYHNNFSTINTTITQLLNYSITQLLKHLYSNKA